MYPPIAPIIPIHCKDLPPEKDGWAWELKLDGFRRLADTINGRMLSKTLNPLKRFQHLLDALPLDCVFDGEICVLDNDGRPRFNDLQFGRGDPVHEAVPNLPSATQTGQTRWIATVDQKLLLDFLYSLNPDCSSKGFAAVRVVEKPKNGKLITGQGTGFPNFPKDNPRHECNTRKTDGISVFYEPNAGFIGPDSIALDVIFPSGNLNKRRYSIEVKPPQTVELTRVVAADQKLQLEFVYALNPDCASIGYATVRVLERPKNGKVAIEKGTGFTSFPQNNPRYECNKRKSDGVAVFYKPKEGFTGADSVTIDVVFPYGNATRRHYSIDVR